MKGPAAYLNTHNEADAGIHQPVEQASATQAPVLATPVVAAAAVVAAATTKTASCYAVTACGYAPENGFEDEWH